MERVFTQYWGGVWETAVLRDPWKVHDPSMHPTLQYKKENDRVYLRGMIGGGKSKASQLITIIPEGYRPSTNKAFPALCRPTEEGSAVVIQLVVQSNGWIYLHTTGSDTVYDNMFAVMLDNVNFELD